MEDVTQEQIQDSLDAGSFRYHEIFPISGKEFIRDDYFEYKISGPEHRRIFKDPRIGSASPEIDDVIRYDDGFLVMGYRKLTENEAIDMREGYDELLEHIKTYEDILDIFISEGTSRVETERKDQILRIMTPKAYVRSAYEIFAIPRIENIDNISSRIDEEHLEIIKYLKEAGVKLFEREEYSIEGDGSIKVTWKPVY